MYFVDGNRNLNEIRAKFMIKAEEFISVLFKLLSKYSIGEVRNKGSKSPTEADCYSWNLKKTISNGWIFYTMWKKTKLKISYFKIKYVIICLLKFWREKLIPYLM